MERSYRSTSQIQGASAPFADHALQADRFTLERGRISEAEREIDEAMRWSIHSSIWQTKVKLLAMTGRPQAALAIVDDASNRPEGTTNEQLERWRAFLAAMASREAPDIERAVTDNR